MSKLLINEPPLQVLPTLAARIGLNEAIFLQQLHYWITNPKWGQEVDGRRWVRNTVAEWQVENFPFWSINTIRRVVASLEQSGLVLTRDDLNSLNYDKTKWYSIDYQALELAASPVEETPAAEPTTQNGQSLDPLPKMGRPTTQNGQLELPKMGNAIPETLETTTEIDGDDPAHVREAFPEPADDPDRDAALDAVQMLGLFNATDLERFNDLWPELVGRRDWIGRAVTVTRDAQPRAPIPYLLKVLANAIHTNQPPGNQPPKRNGRSQGHDLDALLGITP